MSDMQTETPKPGSMNLFSKTGPRLKAGDYVIEVTQSLSWSGQEQTFQSRQNLSVVVPRFALAPGDVFTVFPPANCEGDFSFVLPNVLLAQPGLPWARSLSQQTDERCPWLALLLFEEGELLNPLAAADPQAPPPMDGAAAYQVSDFFKQHADPSVLWPKLDRENLDRDEDLCQAIDLPPQTFLAVAPRLEELSYLTHVRQVTIEGEVTTQFAVVLSNRLPAPGVRNIAHLVSLEGWDEYLPGGPRVGELEEGSIYHCVRLISLASWSFIARTGAGDFMQLASQVAANNEVLSPPAAALAAQTGEHPENRGYLTVNFESADGQMLAGWYRGPLAPEPPALMVDPPAGPEEALSDFSHQAARELGRLLALSDRPFVQSQLNWREALRTALTDAVEKSGQTISYASVLASPTPTPAAQIRAQAPMFDLEGSLGRLVLSLALPGDTASPLPSVPRGDPSGQAAQLDRMVGLTGPASQRGTEAPQRVADVAGAAPPQPEQVLLDRIIKALAEGRDPTQALLEK
jgi:hypothetical protein